MARNGLINVQLLDVGADGVAPDEVALAHEMEAVVGEIGAKAALLVGEQGVEVDPGNSLAASDLFKKQICLDNDMVTALKELPLSHVVVKRQKALKIDLGTRGALLDHDDKFLHRSSNTIGTHLMRNVIDSTHDEQFLGLPLDDKIDAVNQALDNVAHDSAVLDMTIAQQLIELATVGEAIAEHNDVLFADGQLIEKGRPSSIVGVLVGLRHHGEAHQCHHHEDR